ncbi:MAG: prephenate dehydrogenase/arogenate dehydrogenase family protein, partial [Sedimentibacter sp.]|uniref:prephenate dehydrogenase/arogenate dehydrogenase family protein n=1 Tax=Sedimentibacter sp. TaxID=1960295 RepID=UPI002981CF40
KKVGFIGMGIMGLPMASNLLKKSKLEIAGFDVVEEKRKTFKEIGGISVDNTDEITNTCDIIFLCLPTNDLVKSSIQNIIDTKRKGTIIVDLSSTAPNVIREMYAKAKDTEINLLDSPVSGGEKGAVEGTLAIMCGGDKEVFDRVEQLLHFMGTTVTYMGKTGCGSVAKLANNMIVGCNIAAVGEALAFAVKAGLDPEVLFTAIKDGFAGSAVFSSKAPKIISRDFEASARIAVHQKDLKNAVNLADELGIEIPISNMVLDFMNEMEANGKANEDHCAIAKIYEKRMGVEIKKQQ